ncbi:carboxylesterase [Crucibulum laeve]|uniref:Carboxylic ester hydrolase n=1 Tax=Crucibulum laeve TaxID=68775 RepID=A0A5C3MM60_9AGAR|nr:carboxylesterase [Crucibulum laeve]
MGLISAFFLSAGFVSAVASQSTGLTVHTAQGDVAGTLVVPTVRQFLGVPYATAKRWETPSQPPVRSSVLQATAFGDTCVQALTPTAVTFLTISGAGGINVTESENCHTVNIWSPSTNRKQNTAVMLWIYGGSFQFGTSNIPVYNGQNIVRDNDDVTVVTFNYRTNIFGQPNAPQLLSTTKSQNFGLLDLDAAVQWVHTNIAAFGGDPNRIVLFGQSAGSIATDAYTFAHPQDTIVKGVIQESGTLALLRIGGLSNPTFDDTDWNTIASAVGCGTNNDAAQFSCMQNVPFRTLEDAVLSTGTSFNLLTDDITIFSDVNARAAAGKFLHVPVLGGTTAQEGDILVVAEELVNLGFTIPVATEAAADVVTLAAFTCPAGVNAQQRVHVNVPTWRYQYQAVFPDISTRPDLRAYHASEIAIVFGTYNASTSGVPPTPEEIALSKYVQNVWVAFAKNPARGLIDNLGWPTYNSLTKSFAQLGNALNKTGVTFTTGALIDLTCAGADALLAATELPGGGPIKIF